jgi:hypothetical protein
MTLVRSILLSLGTLLLVSCLPTNPPADGPSAPTPSLSLAIDPCSSSDPRWGTAEYQSEKAQFQTIVQQQVEGFKTHFVYAVLQKWIPKPQGGEIEPKAQLTTKASNLIMVEGLNNRTFYRTFNSPGAGQVASKVILEQSNPDDTLANHDPEDIAQVQIFRYFQSENSGAKCAVDLVLAPSFVPWLIFGVGYSPIAYRTQLDSTSIFSAPPSAFDADYSTHFPAGPGVELPSFNVLDSGIDPGGVIVSGYAPIPSWLDQPVGKTFCEFQGPNPNAFGPTERCPATNSPLRIPVIFEFKKGDFGGGSDGLPPYQTLPGASPTPISNDTRVGPVPIASPTPSS